MDNQILSHSSFLLFLDSGSEIRDGKRVGPGFKDRIRNTEF